MLTGELTPKELVYKHIFDKSHTVTEEELKNVRVGFLRLEGNPTGASYQETKKLQRLMPQLPSK